MTQRPAPLEHVLVATDFSEGATRAALRAASLPLAAGARLSLVHVVPERLPARAAEEVERAAQRQLTRHAAMLRKAVAAPRAVVTSERGQGRPFAEIDRLARSLGAQLIVVGRHGERPVRDMLIGSTADRLVRVTRVPVLVVQAPVKQRYRRPLVAVDLEPSAERVVRAAQQVGGADVPYTLAHAFDVSFESLVKPALSSAGLADLRKEYRADAQARLDALVARLGPARAAWHRAVLRGDARQVVLAEAVRRGADLLVVGSRGRSALAEALLGGVATWLVAAAPCDVLVVRSAR